MVPVPGWQRAWLLHRREEPEHCNRDVISSTGAAGILSLGLTINSHYYILFNNKIHPSKSKDLIGESGSTPCSKWRGAPRSCTKETEGRDKKVISKRRGLFQARLLSRGKSKVSDCADGLIYTIR